MEDLERVPAAQGKQALAERLVVAAADADIGNRSVRGLRVRAQRVVMKGGRAQARGHALGERAPVVRARHEVLQAARTTP